MNDIAATSDRRVTVAAVDDHPTILAGLKAELAEIDPGLHFVATASTVPDLLATVQQVDVVLLDLQLNDGTRPATNVSNLIARDCQVLIYTEGSNRAWADEAVRAGALGVWLKSQPVMTVASALRAVAAGDVAETAELAQLLQTSTTLPAQLSPQEKEVLRLYAAGVPAKSVARRVGIGTETAKEYLKRIRFKYAAADRPAATRSELYIRALEDGILEPPNFPQPR